MSVGVRPLVQQYHTKSVPTLSARIASLSRRVERSSLVLESQSAPSVHGAHQQATNQHPQTVVTVTVPFQTCCNDIERMEPYTFMMKLKSSEIATVTITRYALFRCLLIGQNGAGKSTLLRVLAGRHLTKPDDAVIVLDK